MRNASVNEVGKNQKQQVTNRLKMIRHRNVMPPQLITRRVRRSMKLGFRPRSFFFMVRTRIQTVFPVKSFTIAIAASPETLPISPAMLTTGVRTPSSQNWTEANWSTLSALELVLLMFTNIRNNLMLKNIKTRPKCPIDAFSRI